MPFTPQRKTAAPESPANPITLPDGHPFVVYGTPKRALQRLTELYRAPRRLTPDECVERDLIGGAFADMRNLLVRFDQLTQ